MMAEEKRIYESEGLPLPTLVVKRTETEARNKQQGQNQRKAGDSGLTSELVMRVLKRVKKI